MPMRHEIVSLYFCVLHQSSLFFILHASLHQFGEISAFFLRVTRTLSEKSIIVWSEASPYLRKLTPIPYRDNPRLPLTEGELV